MRKLLTGLLDCIFPPTTHEKVLRNISPEALKSIFQPGNFQGIEFLGHYSDKVLSVVITENKFHNQPKAAKFLSLLLKKWHDTQTANTLYVPIPLGSKRHRERGHNQAETILKHADIKNINTTLLKRTIETTPQTTLHKSERLQNMKGVFAYNDTNFDFSPFTQVIIFDDVVTTGATLLTARATLAPHLPPHLKLRCLAIAH